MSVFLITGGAGFIGSHLARALTARGDDVVVLDNLSTGRRENLRPAEAGPGRLKFIAGDMRDADVCARAMEGVDYVLHQAARANVQRSIENPLLTNQVNVEGGLNVLNAARQAGVKRLVNAGSSSVYGDREPVDAPKVESMDPLPRSPYAASKLALEDYCKVFTHVYGMETVTLRYFNVFGPRQDPESQYAAVIPRFLFSLLAGEPPVIFGDGRQARDFTYIDNVVAANLAAIEAPGAAGETINVAGGKSHDLLELLAILQQHTGRNDIQPRFAPARAGDVRYSLADLTKAKRLLGYEVTVDFAEGLARVVKLAMEGEYLAR